MLDSIKTLKKSILLLAVTLMMQGIISPVYDVYAASSIDRIDIEVTVNEDGSAHFKETWNATVENGTEASKSLIQLNGAEISNFKVTNELGKEYTVSNTWDSSKSRIDKYTSAGLQVKMNGDTTLYWGLGDYGSRAYILEYDVSNFVENCVEGQFSYFTFISPNQVPFPKDMSVKVTAPESIGFDTLNCFNYGFEAEKEFTSTKAIEQKALKEMLGEDEEEIITNTIDISNIIGDTQSNSEAEDIEDSSTDQQSKENIVNITEEGEKPNILMYEPKEFTFGSGSYVVMLMKYDTANQQFNTAFSSNKSFMDVLNEANEGMGLGVVTQPKTIKEIAVVIAAIAAPILVILWIRAMVKRHKKVQNKAGLPIKLNFTESNQAVDRIENVRPEALDMRLTKEINFMYEVYLVGTYYKVVPSTYSIFASLLVKWIINKNIEIVHYDESITQFRLMLRNIPEKAVVSNFEHELFKLFERIDNSDTSVDGIDLKKLDRWLKVNSLAFLNWRDEILKAEARLLQNKGVLEVVQMSERLQKSATFTEYNVTDAFKNMGNTLQSIKRYIREFEYRGESIENIKEYIVLAQLFDSTNVFLNGLEDSDFGSDEIKEILGGNDKDKLLMTVSQLNSVISTRLESSKGQSVKQNRKKSKKAKKKSKKSEDK